MEYWLDADSLPLNRPLRRDPATGRWTVVADRRHIGFVEASDTCGLGHIDGRTVAKVRQWLGPHG